MSGSRGDIGPALHDLGLDIRGSDEHSASDPDDGKVSSDCVAVDAQAQCRLRDADEDFVGFVHDTPLIVFARDPPTALKVSIITLFTMDIPSYKTIIFEARDIY